MKRACRYCDAPITRGAKKGRCRSCAATESAANAETQERRRATLARVMRRPDVRSRHLAGLYVARQMRRVRNGARVIEKMRLPAREPEFSVVGGTDWGGMG